MATRKQLEQQYIEDRAFWGSVSSRWRGLAGGVLLGGLIGAALAVVGLATCALIGVEIGAGAVGGMIGILSASGMAFGANMWGSSGQISGGVAHGLMAMRELEMGGKARELYKEFTPAQNTPKIEEAKKPLFNWKVMGIGAAIAGTLGAVMAGFNVFPAEYLLLGQAAGTGAGAAVAAVTCGAFGTVFGIHFRPWQAVKRGTDGFFEGKISGRTAAATDTLRDQLIATAPKNATIELQVVDEAPSKPVHSQRILTERQQELLKGPQHTALN